MNCDRTAKRSFPSSILDLFEPSTNQPCPRLVNGKASQASGIGCFGHVGVFVRTTGFRSECLALSRTLDKAQCVLWKDYRLWVETWEPDDGVRGKFRVVDFVQLDFDNVGLIKPAGRKRFK